MMDRRDILASGAAMMALTACGRQTPSLAVPGQGWVVSRGGEHVASDLSGQAVIETGRAFTLDAPFRIASITKLVVAMAIHDWAAAGKLDLSAPVGDILPDTPDTLTLHHLLSHQSGLRDPEVYWADIQTDIRTLYDRAHFTHAPGTFFRYANLNYGLAATVVEAQLGERFDRLIWNWLTRRGLDAGLNWSGVSLRRRLKAAALYRDLYT